MKAITNCVLAFLEKPVIYSIIQADYTSKVTERYTFLKEYPFFEDFSYRELFRLSQMVNENNYKKGDMIYEAHDREIDEIYFIKDGSFMLQSLLQSNP
jgi:hypothetical protein